MAPMESDLHLDTTYCEEMQSLEERGEEDERKISAQVKKYSQENKEKKEKK